MAIQVPALRAQGLVFAGRSHLQPARSGLPRCAFTGPALESGLHTLIRFDPASTLLVVCFLVPMLPLLVRLVLATGKRELRLKAALLAKRLKRQAAAAPGDMVVFRALQEARAEVATCKAEEEELRSLRLLGGPVIAKFGVLDTVEIQKLRRQLVGVLPADAAADSSPDWPVTLSLVMLLLMLVPYLFLTLTEPVSFRAAF
eukprot:CAMPEP_0171093326 /NCGR_PEP_ID=MMETSP0766_2-20121228/39015_1 /TAXON_ID=439317 /ORGANISM="Gambierdiscus australes, Strain CAWD 149" /LENGTH=200 /DNA_ID=CAMNT_0011551757 /DNA_START=57 /DNA_END=659 /DNA_ORIENTATION=-